MPTHKGKITIYQALILFVLSTLSPAIRLYASLAAKYADQASWVSPIISSVGLIIILKVFVSVFRNKDITSLGDFFNRALGRAAGRFTLLLFLIWVVILYFLYIRYYAERLVMTIFTGTSIKLFILVLMLLVFMATRGKLESFARFCEISFLIFTAVFIVFFLFLAPSVKLGNVWPVTHLDAVPVIKGTYPILGILGYITFIFLLGDRIINKDQLSNYKKKVVLYITLVSTLIVFVVAGSLGPSVTARMPIPFFSAVKVVSIMETLDRLESVLLSIWVISDFIVVSLFALFIISIIKDLFKIAETRYLSTPVALLGYGGSQYLASSRFELAAFSSALGLSVNIVICFIFPVLIYIIGKIRRKI